MMYWKRMLRQWLLVGIAATVILGCNLANLAAQATATPVPTATVDSAATQNARTTEEARNAEFTRAAINLQATTVALQATQKALEAPPTQPPSEPATPAPSGQATPNSPPTPSQNSAFAAVIQKLVEEGKLSSATGDYYKLDDFDQSTARMGYLEWYPTEYSAENFAISADMAWSSASKTANWPEAGCGFVFGEQENKDLAYSYLALDGFAYTSLKTNGAYVSNLPYKRWGKPELPDGSAKFMLVVNNKKATLYANDKAVVELTLNALKPGGIGLTVFSGTNKDFGTRCKMSNINLFIPK